MIMGTLSIGLWLLVSPLNNSYLASLIMYSVLLDTRQQEEPIPTAKSYAMLSPTNTEVGKVKFETRSED